MHEVTDVPFPLVFVAAIIALSGRPLSKSIFRCNRFNCTEVIQSQLSCQ